MESCSVTGALDSSVALAGAPPGQFLQHLGCKGSGEVTSEYFGSIGFIGFRLEFRVAQWPRKASTIPDGFWSKV